MKILLFLLTAVVLLVTTLPLLHTATWWVRAMDFLRLQAASIGLLGLVVGVLAYDSALETLGALVVLGVCVAYQSHRIFPYTVLSPLQALPVTKTDPSTRFRLLVVNIQMDNRQGDRFLQAVYAANPDIICLLEPDTWWAHRLQELTAQYPYTVQQPQDNFYGMIVYSRLKLVRSEITFLVEDDIPSIQAEVELRCGTTFDLYCLHPRPPVPAIDTEERDAELLLVGKIVRKSGRPSVVCGDLNDVAGSYINNLFQKMSGLLDPRIGRGLYNTHPTYLPIARSPVDHVFHSNDFRLVDLKRLEDVGSDHFPILVELSYEPAKQAEQPEPTPTSEEKQEAHTIIAQAQ